LNALTLVKSVDRRRQQIGKGRRRFVQTGHGGQISRRGLGAEQRRNIAAELFEAVDRHFHDDRLDVDLAPGGIEFADDLLHQFKVARSGGDDEGIGRLVGQDLDRALEITGLWRSPTSRAGLRRAGHHHGEHLDQIFGVRVGQGIDFNHPICRHLGHGHDLGDFSRRHRREPLELQHRKKHAVRVVDGKLGGREDRHPAFDLLVDHEVLLGELGEKLHQHREVHVLEIERDFRRAGASGHGDRG
jgi:hypothetical protein